MLISPTEPNSATIPIFSPDDKYLVIGSRTALKVWEVSTKKLIYYVNKHKDNITT